MPCAPLSWRALTRNEATRPTLCASSARSTAHREPPEVEPSEIHYRQAMALAEELGMRPLVAHCHLGLGKLYRRTGKREQARDHLTTAVTALREMEMMYWLAKAEAEMKELP